MERAEKLVSKRNQGVVSEANTKMKKVKEQMQKLCNLAEHLRAMVEQVMGGVLKLDDMEDDDCRRLLQAVQTMVKELAPFNQVSADMMGVTIKPSTVRASRACHPLRVSRVAPGCAPAWLVSVVSGWLLRALAALTLSSSPSDAPLTPAVPLATPRRGNSRS